MIRAAKSAPAGAERQPRPPSGAEVDAAGRLTEEGVIEALVGPARASGFLSAHPEDLQTD